MKKFAFLVVMLSCIAMVFDSCKKETLYTVEIDGAGWFVSIDYFVNGVQVGTTNNDAEFDAKEGDVITVTCNPGNSDTWSFFVYGFRITRGNKADIFNVQEVGGSFDPVTPTITFTLPH